MRHSLRRWEIVRYGAAGLSLFAALIHAWVMPERFREWWGYGLFFLAAALAQGIYSAILMKTVGRPLVLAGIVGLVMLLRVGLPPGGLAPNEGHGRRVHWRPSKRA